MDCLEELPSGCSPGCLPCCSGVETLSQVRDRVSSARQWLDCTRSGTLLVVHLSCLVLNPELLHLFPISQSAHHREPIRSLSYSPESEPKKPIRYCWFSIQTAHHELFKSNCIVELVLKYNVNCNEILI